MLVRELLVETILLQWQQPDCTGIGVQFNFELLARLQSQAFGVGMTDQKIAVAMDAGFELSLTTTWTTSTAGAS